jgi:transcriptional regulator with XRE-family HTH domain
MAEMLPADRLLLERIGARLREIREGAKLSQETVGERAGFGGKYIGEIEKGIRDVPVSTLRAVVENGLGIQLESLFSGRVRRVDAGDQTHAQDVEITAAMLAELPIRLRRPILALVKAIGDQPVESQLSKAAERRRQGWDPPKRK